MNPPGRSGAKFSRVLVVDTNVATAKMLAGLLRDLCPGVQVYGAGDAEKAMALAVELEPDLVFVEATGAQFNGLAFTRAYRRCDYDCREAPIIMIFGAVTAAQVLEARDAGVHEFLRRPYTLGDLQKRLDAVSGRPRDWIEALGYVGPDRRRFNSADYNGPLNRAADGSDKSQKINQALRILQSVAGQMDADPVQAARALNTQARVLIEMSVGQPLFRPMAAAASQLQTYLTTVAQQGVSALSKDQVGAHSAKVLAAAPEEVKPRAA